MHAPQTDIILRHGNVELARMTLPPGQYTIGRDRNSHIFVNTPLLSRQHARLTIEEDRLLVEDLGSSNGTFINDQRVTGVSALLPNQDVRLGDVHLELRRHAPVEPSASPFKPAATVVAAPLPAPKPAQPAAQPAASPAAKRPAAPASSPHTAPRKSKAGLYGGIGAGLIALGVAAFFLWPRPEALTRAQLYAQAHPTEGEAPAPAATPKTALAAPAARADPQNAPRTSPKPVAKSAAKQEPPSDSKKSPRPPQLATVKPDVATPTPQKTGDSPEDLAADAKALAEAKQKRLDLIAKFQFAEARTAMLEPALKTEKARDEQELLSKKATWLADFKSQLIEDLNVKGCVQPVTRKSGEKVPGGVAQADDQQVTLRSTHAALPWTELSLDSIYEMGLSFIPPDMPPEIAAFRKWHLGVFAFYAGKKKEGLDLLHEAAQIRRVFKDELPLFEKASGPY